MLCAGIVVGGRANGQGVSASPAPDAAYGTAGAYERYTPDACAQLGLWHEQQRVFDTYEDAAAMMISRTGYTVQPATRAAIQACLARFQVATLVPKDLLGFMRAALAGDRAAQADSAAVRLGAWAATQPVATRSWTLVHIIEAYVNAPAPHFAETVPYLRQLDALGVPAAGNRLIAYQIIASHAHVRDSVELEASALRASLAASRSVTGVELVRYVDPLAATYARYADYLARTGAVDSAKAVIARGMQVLGPTENRGDMARAMLHQRLVFLGRIGQRAPSIVATRWYGAGSAVDTAALVVDQSSSVRVTNSQTAATVTPQRPRAGRAALIVIDTKDRAMFYPNPGYETLRRLASTYGATGATGASAGDSGVDVTFVVRTIGMWDGKLATPEVEMAGLRDYWLGVRQMPVTLAVATMPAPGMAMVGDALSVATIDQAYPPLDDPPIALGQLIAYLVDKQGIVRLVTVVNRENEAMLDSMLSALQ